MSQTNRITLKVNIIKASAFVTNGATTFTAVGVALVAGGRDKYYTLCIHSAGVRSSRDLSQLSLMGHGSSAVFDFEGEVFEDGFVVVDNLHCLKMN